MGKQHHPFSINFKLVLKINSCFKSFIISLITYIQTNYNFKRTDNVIGNDCVEKD